MVICNIFGIGIGIGIGFVTGITFGATIGFGIGNALLQVHERTVDSDFLIIILRDLALRRNDLTLVLMSATLNADVSVLLIVFLFFYVTPVCVLLLAVFLRDTHAFVVFYVICMFKSVLTVLLYVTPARFLFVFSPNASDLWLGGCYP